MTNHIHRGILAGACAVVIVVYACAAHSGTPLSGKMGAADNYYNLLVEGFRAGQLSLKKEVPPALAQLADPYDPSAYASYGPEAGDMSYYKGKLYLYFGVTPAVLLFWPYVALSGQYLLQRDAVVIFCLVGFLISVGLLRALWRRYFAEVSVWVVAALALALGLATSTPFFLGLCKANEVPISCGYMLTMLALAAIWKGLHESRKRSGCRWLAAASLAYGLALGARPSLLFGAVILLVPVVQAWRERGDLAAAESRTASGSRSVAGRGPPMAAAAVIPLALIGLGLMLYNCLRFDSPFEFGWRYQLAGLRQDTGSPFHLRYLWYNFRLYFLDWARWSHRFPFVHDIIAPPEPAGHAGGIERTFGVLTNIPLVWLALAVPLAWRGRADHRSEKDSRLLSEQGHIRQVPSFNGIPPEGGTQCRRLCQPLGGFLATIATLFGISALTLGLYFYTAGRYEMEFLPALVLLAVIGILGLERALAPTSESGQAVRTIWRRAVRWGWGLLLAFSVAFNLLVSVKLCAVWHDDLGAALGRQGKLQEAIGHFEQALRLNPDYVDAHNNLGAVLIQLGRMHEAVEQYEQVLRVNPDFAEAHGNLGLALMGLGKLQEAIGHYEQALRVKPDYAEAHYNLGLVLEQEGRPQEAIQQYEQALRIKPDFVQARNALARVRAAQ